MNGVRFRDRRRRGVACVVVVARGFGAALAGCYSARHGKASFPADYRQRHPIAIREGDRTFEVFVGNTRGGLPPAQRAEVVAFAQTWAREGTGGLMIDVPAGTPNELAAGDALREIRSISDGGAASHPTPSLCGPTDRDQPALATIRFTIRADRGGRALRAVAARHRPALRSHL